MSDTPTTPPVPSAAQAPAPVTLEERLKILRMYYRAVYARSIHTPVMCSPYWRRNGFTEIAALAERCRFQALHSSGTPQDLADALMVLAAQCAVNYVALYLAGQVKVPEQPSATPGQDAPVSVRPKGEPDASV